MEYKADVVDADDAIERELLDIMRDLPPREKRLVLMLAKSFAKKQYPARGD